MDSVLERMAVALRVGNYAKTTQGTYLSYVRRFEEFHGRSTEELGADEAMVFLEHLGQQGMQAKSVRLARAALVFAYGKALGRRVEIERIPVPRRSKRVPMVLSGAEVERLLHEVQRVKLKAVLMSMYSAGLRISEACALRPEDIDSDRMLIRVRGKGGKERYTLLAQRLLSYLRHYWVGERPSNGWLFPGRGQTGHVHRHTVSRAFGEAVAAAGIRKPVVPHSLRHGFATHLKDLGVNLSVVQALMGHSSLRTTQVYLHTSREEFSRVTSPLDVLGRPAGHILG